MSPRKTVAALLLAVPLAAAPLLAQGTKPTPGAGVFVMKAGASDRYEIESSKLVQSSTNPAIQQFAQQMISDHTNSTAQIKQAAGADHVSVPAPTLDAAQAAMIRNLRARNGKARDQLYVQQQKTSHQKALDLMQGYAANGKSPALKAAAGQIAPVVQGHLDMLNQMPAA